MLKKSNVSIYSAQAGRNFRAVHLICDAFKEDNKQQMINGDETLESEIMDDRRIILSMTETNGSKDEEDGGG